MSMLVNLSLSAGVVPVNLKYAKVCPVFKEGSRNDFGNYRLISILPSFSKIYEKVVYNRLYGYLAKFNVLTDSQFGFRKDSSTYMAQLNLVDLVSKAIDDQLYSAGIFIDLKKPSIP